MLVNRVRPGFTHYTLKNHPLPQPPRAFILNEGESPESPGPSAKLQRPGHVFHGSVWLVSLIEIPALSSGRRRQRPHHHVESVFVLRPRQALDNGDSHVIRVKGTKPPRVAHSRTRTRGERQSVSLRGKAA